MSIKFGKNPCKILENIFRLVHLAEDFPEFFVAIDKKFPLFLTFYTLLRKSFPNLGFSLELSPPQAVIGSPLDGEEWGVLSWKKNMWEVRGR